MNTKEPASATPPPTLEYGHSSRLGVIGRHKKKLIFLALCIAIVIPAYRNRESIKQRAIWHYWNHLAAAYQMPEKPSPLLLFPNLVGASEFAANPGYTPLRSTGGARAAPAGPSSFYEPQAYRELLSRDPQMYWTTDPRGRVNPVIFMGARRRPDGATRLVVLTGDKALPGLPIINLKLVVRPMPGWFDPPPPPTLATLPSGRYTIDPPSLGQSEFQTGQADPKDPTHIILHLAKPPALSTEQKAIHYVEPPTSIDAYLQNDDSLRFEFNSDKQLGRSQTLAGNTSARSAAALAAQRQRPGNAVVARGLTRRGPQYPRQPATRP